MAYVFAMVLHRCPIAFLAYSMVAYIAVILVVIIYGSYFDLLCTVLYYIVFRCFKRCLGWFIASRSVFSMAVSGLSMGFLSPQRAMRFGLPGA